MIRDGHAIAHRDANSARHDAIGRVVAAAQLACVLEATAPKPGNVSPGRDFADSRYEDYLASAAAIGGPLMGIAERPLGSTVRLAVEATRQWTRSNTNLGIVLLLAPLARAAVLAAARPGGRALYVEAVGNGLSASARPSARPRLSPPAARKGGQPVPQLRDEVRSVLDATTVGDAREVYAAIRLAAPAGLGRVDRQDVSEEPESTLVEVMRLAMDRDGIAREYATAFETTFEVATPALQRARADGLSWSDAIVETFLTLLAAAADTHIVRRSGAALGAEVSRRARAVLDAGGVRSDAGRCAIEELDRALRDPCHAANPGTTADLTAAATFVVLMAE
jgi:triphosphoribosyl-dephospho-CoA synthase